ncbi:hypothetical protein GCM10009734_25950 [Nonomuraea bangladeshensis]
MVHCSRPFVGAVGSTMVSPASPCPSPAEQGRNPVHARWWDQDGSEICCSPPAVEDPVRLRIVSIVAGHQGGAATIAQPAPRYPPQDDRTGRQHDFRMAESG